MERHDVVVVGAGLAGLQTARLLARSGAGVLLVDAKPSLDRTVHTTGIFVRKTLEDFDLPRACLGPPVREVVLYSPARRALVLRSPRDEYRVGRMARLYGHLLDECRAAGAAWLPSTRYLGCESAGEDSILRLEGGGRQSWVRARYLVGADGARSLVAQDLGLDVNRRWIVGVEEVYHGARGSASPRLHCFLDPSLAPGYLAWIVEDGEELHVGVGGYPSLFDPLAALERFRASVGGIVDFRGTRRVERRGGRIPVGGVLGRIANRRGLLVGDAAGAPSPLTAGGLDPCMRLSELAARVIAGALAADDRSVLGAYAGRRFRARFLARRSMRALFAAMRRPAPLEAACAFLRTPLLRPLAAHIFFGRNSFPDVSGLPAPPIGSPQGQRL